MNITSKIQLDLVRRGVTSYIDAVQFDGGARMVEITLTADGQPWTPPADVVVSVAFQNARTGHKGRYDTLPDGSPACMVAGNVVTLALAPAVLADAGEVLAWVVFQDSRFHQLATFSFRVLVEENAAADLDVLNDYYRYTSLEQINDGLVSFEQDLNTTYEQVLRLENELGEAYDEIVQVEAKVVDKLCPAFDESGAAVRCEPVEGYPLSVVSVIDATEDGVSGANLWHGGKNLFDMQKVRDGMMSYEEATGLWTIDTKALSGITTPIVSLLVPVAGSTNPTAEQVKDLILVPGNTEITVKLNDLAVCTADESDVTQLLHTTILLHSADGTRLATQNWWYSHGDTKTFTTPNNTPCYLDIRRNSANVLVSFSSVQIEVGSATAYEPYRGETITQDFGKTVYGGSYDWVNGILTDADGNETRYEPQAVLAVEGVNTLFADTGAVQVSGRCDTKALFEKLTNAILALGGNI